MEEPNGSWIWCTVLFFWTLNNQTQKQSYLIVLWKRLFFDQNAVSWTYSVWQVCFYLVPHEKWNSVFVFCLQSWLRMYGYLPQASRQMSTMRSAQILSSAVSDMQRFYGLEVTGTMDPETIRLGLWFNACVETNAQLWKNRSCKSKQTWNFYQYSPFHLSPLCLFHCPPFPLSAAQWRGRAVASQTSLEDKSKPMYDGNATLSLDINGARTASLSGEKKQTNSEIVYKLMCRWHRFETCNIIAAEAVNGTGFILIHLLFPVN